MKMPPEWRRLSPITTGGIQQGAAEVNGWNLWPPLHVVNPFLFLDSYPARRFIIPDYFFRA
jgi:hypothetical protein